MYVVINFVKLYLICFFFILFKVLLVLEDDNEFVLQLLRVLNISVLEILVRIVCESFVVLIFFVGNFLLNNLLDVFCYQFLQDILVGYVLRLRIVVNNLSVSLNLYVLFISVFGEILVVDDVVFSVIFGYRDFNSRVSVVEEEYDIL